MIQDIKLIATDPIQFFKLAQEVIIRGARYKDNTFVSLKTMPLMAELTVDVGDDPNAEWKDKGPNIWATPLPMKEMKYTKEYLESTPIAELRDIFASRGVVGRDKTKMIKEYFESFESKE